MKRFSQRVVGLASAFQKEDGVPPDNKLTRFQLSRAGGKDSSKSTKKKDSKDGTASPNSAGSKDTNQSPNLTPSSSTSTLNDIRNKPLPPNNQGLGDHGASGLGAPSQGSGQNPGVPDRFSSMGTPQQGANGGSTPGRLGPLPPTVIISPSAPVGTTRSRSHALEQDQPDFAISVAYTASWCARDHAS